MLGPVEQVTAPYFKLTVKQAATMEQWSFIMFRNINTSRNIYEL